MLAAVSYLPVTLSVGLNLADELASRKAGPVFSDEYTRLILSPTSAVVEDRLHAMERAQDSFATAYLKAWVRQARRIARERGMTLSISLNGTVSDSPPAAHFRNEITSLISVNNEGDTWKVMP